MAQVIPYFSSKLHGIYDRANSTVCDQGVTHCRYKRTNQRHPHNRNAFSILPPSDSPPALVPQHQPIAQYNTTSFLKKDIYHVYSSLVQFRGQISRHFRSTASQNAVRLADGYMKMGGVYVRPLRRVYTNIPTTICESLTETEGDRQRKRKNGECTLIFKINYRHALMKIYMILTYVSAEAKKSRNRKSFLQSFTEICRQIYSGWTE